MTAVPQPRPAWAADPAAELPTVRMCEPTRLPRDDRPWNMPAQRDRRRPTNRGHW